MLDVMICYEGLLYESKNFDVDSHVDRYGNRYRAAADGQSHLLVCRYFPPTLVQTARR